MLLMVLKILLVLVNRLGKELIVECLLVFVLVSVSVFE